MWKNRLQEWCQKSGRPLPAYDTRACPAGWTCTVTVQGLPPATAEAAGRKVAAEQAAAEQACGLLHSIALCAPRPGKRPDAWDAVTRWGTVVFVDADHIAFVDEATVCRHATVAFAFYHAFGAHLPHVQSLGGYANVAVRGAPAPAADMADCMICIDVARAPADTRCVVVSRDKLLYNLVALLPNVVYASTAEQLGGALECK
jgi:hypothetical protein